MKKINAGVGAGIVVFLLSLVFLSQSFQYSYTSEVGPGPGFFPVWLSGILLVLSLIYIFQSAKAQSDSGIEWPKGQALKNILFILGCLFLFLILVSFAGFILSSVIFLSVLLYRAYKWYINLSISIVVSVFLFWLFGDVLGVALPVNALGF